MNYAVNALPHLPHLPLALLLCGAVGIPLWLCYWFGGGVQVTMLPVRWIVRLLGQQLRPRKAYK